MSEKKSENMRISSVLPFGLRMLPDLRERIAASAQENGRSLNAEITERLEQSFRVVDGYDPKLRNDDLAYLVIELKERDALIREYRKMLLRTDHATVEFAFLMESFTALILSFRDQIPERLVDFANDMSETAMAIRDHARQRIADFHPNATEAIPMPDDATSPTDRHNRFMQNIQKLKMD